MTKMEFNEKLMEYARDELETVDGVVHPTWQQVVQNGPKS